ncbi:hypothetical protein SAMN05216480_10388 [Pustulibacterium marinum]|uniref:Outer membrane efflux protein n=1 Tax=Pustulibacterium marinum TaxID=1224947 RepID=A0A1I7G2D5_9FLAO|nr:hypothetical protein [Pustulibacterium marinum]SFU42579.1 hypothetical protein SAMN05216480_10388 [Pustulibacterium marinum]
MKTKLLIAFSLFFFGFAQVEAQEKNKALEYLEFLSKENEKLNTQVWQYTKAVAHDKRPRKIEKTRKNLVTQIQLSKRKISQMPSVDGDDTYKNEFVNYLTIYENSINNDYAKIVDLKEIAEQSYDAMEAYILLQEKVDEKMEHASTEIDSAQATFAKKYNINLVAGQESDLSKKMKISNAVFQHKNAAYLPFFKANFQENLLIGSLGSHNVGDIQQKASALQAFAQEGLDSLQTIQAYNNDSSIIDVTKKVLLFYKEEAEISVPEMIDFMLLNDKITKMQQALESKKAKDRTKEEIDEYNNLVKQVNTEVAKFNKTNERLNQERTVLLTEWETVSNNFLSKHIPKN